MIEQTRATATLAAILRGEHVSPWNQAEGDEIVRAAEAHAVGSLIADRVEALTAGTWPVATIDALRRARALAAALETLRHRELIDVLGHLGQRGVHPLLLKGSALAFTLYPDPSLRPRFDVDLLVRRQQMDVVGEVMKARGYVRPAQVTGELVMHQVDYSRRDAQGVWHVLDFHWKLANRHVVADMLSHDELERDAVAIPALGSNARGLGATHALMLACVHRVAHHPTDERLVWLLDIHLLTQSLTPGEAARFAALARDRAVRVICGDGIREATRWFATEVPRGLLEALDIPSEAREQSAEFLRASGSTVDEILFDLRALRGWSARVGFLYEHVFPPARYMTSAYPMTSRAWLPALYTHRILRGAWRWLRSTQR